MTSARQKEPENMDDLWVSFCEYGEGAATPKEKDAYAVAAPVKNMLHCKLTCSRNGCDGIFEISHLLAASFKYWTSPVQHVDCSNCCGNYLEISYKIPSSTE